MIFVYQRASLTAPPTIPDAVGVAGLQAGAPPPPPPPSDPTTITGLTFWGYADHVTLNATTVSAIPDQSGAAVEPTLTQATGANQPTFLASGINALADIQYGGSQFLKGTNARLGVNALTLFGIFKTSSPTSAMLWGMRGSGHHYSIMLNASGTDPGKLSFLNSLFGQAVMGAANLADGAAHFYIATYAANTTGVMNLYVDSFASPTATATGAVGAIGASGDVNAVGESSNGFFAFTGQMPQVGAYNTVLSAGDITTLGTYLKARAGI